jgi:disulfide bond formation protein DsbB
MAQTISHQQAIQAPPSVGAASRLWTWAAFLISVIALAGSLWLSIGMNLKACPLCLYQRTFVMGVVGVLAMGLLTSVRRWGPVDLLALPLAVAGLGVAVFHEYLEATGKLECPGGLLGVGTSPQQSLAAQALLVLFLGIGTLRSQGGLGFGPLSVVGAFVLGLLFVVGAIASAPPMPAAPTKAYEQPLEICRPPFRGP